MKKLQHYYWNLLSAAALFGMVAIFLTGPVQSDDDIEKVKVKDDKIKVKGDDGKVKIKDGEIAKVKGDADEELAMARQALNEREAAEFEASLVEGYTVPQERYVYLDPVPETYVTRLDPVPDGMVYRYFNGNVYTVNPETYTIMSVRTFE